jgi:hypothetical protein
MENMLKRTSKFMNSRAEASTISHKFFFLAIVLPCLVDFSPEFLGEYSSLGQNVPQNIVLNVFVSMAPVREVLAQCDEGSVA